MALFSSKIVASGDDGYMSGPGFDTTSVFIEVGVIAGDDNNAFLRYQNVSIPQGATITNATLTFTARATNSSALPSFRIFLNDVDNAVAPTSMAQYVALVRTSAFVNSVLSPWTVDMTYVSSDVSTVIQEVIDRPGWSSGNALMVLVTDESATDNGQSRSFYSFNNSMATSVGIDITYSSGSASLPGNRAKRALVGVGT